MAKINLLDSSVYNLIAAGEVVERPASVIKELVENSIDAGAKNITIEIKDGGTTFMQVADDGHGIEEDDIKSAFLPHATSKIKEATDLDSIATLGFRGEALASIASVSKVSVVSKTAESELGSKIVVEGGKFGDVQKLSSSTGTVMTVQDLFYCVPARAKFLKKNKTEEQEITNIVTRTILAHPEINFTYIVDGKKNMSSLGSTKKEAMFSVYGKETVNETLAVSCSRDGVSVDGFVGKPTYSKSNRTYQTLIINGRYVVNLTVQTAVANAYGDFLMKRQYPFFVLYLSVPNDEIDVNVHPNKLDVKFLKSNLVYSVVFEAVSRALHEMDYIKEVEEIDAVKPSNFVSPVRPKANEIDKAGVNLNPFSKETENLTQKEQSSLTDIIVDSMLDTGKTTDSVKDNFGIGSRLLERINDKIRTNDETAFGSYGYENSKAEPKPENNFSFINKPEKVVSQESFYEKPKVVQEDFAEDKISIVGKIFNTYLIIEWGDNMYLIDQHAGHERLNYDRLKKEYETGAIAVQPMLIPFVLTLNAEDDQIIQANLDAIRSVGFEIDEFGDRSYKVSAVPVIVGDIDFNKFFSMFLAEKLNKSKITEAELVKDSLMQMACKSAIKGGDDLSKDEINILLSEMGNSNVVLFCPHGRPVVVRITKKEIEKWFKRIV
ncbi:MAG: DNA mismatch repair endonuclease MutL [Clostridiales bacterium]|nr:DNA mismatch repair endonuclease MutL [Clostridiales bacterium]